VVQAHVRDGFAPAAERERWADNTGEDVWPRHGREW
jgi:hypothetical protein